MSLPRLPTKADFPSNIILDIIPPPSSPSSTAKAPVNILILLHGLGDTQLPFVQLGKNLNLPETCCLSIRGPNPIPSLFTGSEDPAFHWGDDVLFDENKGTLDLDAGFTQSSKLLLDDIISKILLEKCNFPARNILLLGFGQGGMAALAVADKTDLEFGGVVSVGGRLPSSSSSSSSSSSDKSKTKNKIKSKTPVLLLGGSRSSEVTSSRVKEVRERFADVEYVKWAKNEDSMPRNREEMLPIMGFFARRLRSRVGVPEGAVEV